MPKHTFAYVWVLCSVAFAFWFHGHEEAQRREEIIHATSSALRVGAMAGCKQNNEIRDQVWETAEGLGVKDRAVLARGLVYEDCGLEADRVVKRYLHAAE